MNRIDRREFVSRGAKGVVAAGLSTLGTTAARAAGANERFVIGVMGLRNRGKRLASLFAAHPDVTVEYLCDVDESMLGPAVTEVTKRQTTAPKTVGDFRRILDDKNVDGLVVAAPDHWHALATVHACAAGKHVYVEKPVSHNLVEGRRMVQAARRYDRVVQAGTQRRSSTALAGMVDFLRSGGIGKIGFVRAWITSVRENIGFAKDGPTPAGVDYDLWLGPAASRPFNPNRFHYRWHWFWDYGTGELGNNGVHALDVARWGVDVDYPQSVVSSGGKFSFDDDQVTPDTQIVCYQYPGMTMVWEHRIWNKHRMDGSNFGVAFHGSDGTVLFDGKRWTVEGGKTPGENVETKLRNLESAHQRNWLDCIKTGKRPNADIEIGHIGAALCHLGNISQRLGRKLVWDGAEERFSDANSDANRLLAREYRSEWRLPTV